MAVGLRPRAGSGVKRFGRGDADRCLEELKPGAYEALVEESRYHPGRVDCVFEARHRLGGLTSRGSADGEHHRR